MKAILKNGVIYPREPIPADWSEGTELEVAKIPSPAESGDTSKSQRSDGESWPPGFIESTFGSIQDESFIRHPQGEFEQRLELTKGGCS